MEKNNFRKIATITLFESAVQWYCFLLYGTAAGTVFNKVFFSQTGNGTTALILSYMSFAIGYIAGPFGAIFFGHIGDRKGRKVTMYASLLMMGISTSIIGILPPAASAGVGVVIVLQLMRLEMCIRDRFDSADLSQYEDKCDLVVHAGTGKIDTNPVSYTHLYEGYESNFDS